MAHTRTQEELEKEIKEAECLVTIGGIYSHAKHPENLYRVLAIGTQEATDKLCVMYQSEYGKKLIFVRDLEDWLATIELDGARVPRFRLVEHAK